MYNRVSQINFSFTLSPWFLYTKHIRIWWPQDPITLHVCMYILKRQGECGKQIDLVIIVVTWKKDTCYNI